MICIYCCFLSLLFLVVVCIGGREEPILVHAGHVLLDEGFDELLHRLLFRQLANQVVFQ